MSVKLPWQKTEQSADAAQGSTKVELPEAEQVEQAEKKLPKGYTPPKGRPTPKRIDQEIKRGVVRDPNAATPAQIRQREKELKKTMSKEEWKAHKKQVREENRARNREIQARMDAREPSLPSASPAAEPANASATAWPWDCFGASTGGNCMA